MPQHELFSEPPSGLSVEVEDLTIVGDPGFRIWVREHRHGQVERTLWVGKMTGLEVDFFCTLMQEIWSAWMFGKPGDLHRAAGSVMRQAKGHARLHERGLLD